MPKYKYYESPVHFLGRKIPPLGRLTQRFQTRLNQWLGLPEWSPELKKLQEERKSSDIFVYSLFLGGFEPLRRMKKDFIDTFKPYKINTHIRREIFQPIRGFGNIFKGIFNLIAAIVIFPANIFRYLLRLRHQNCLTFGSNLLMNLFKTAGGLVDGLMSIVRGCLQIATTPLVWVFKIPLRIILTKVFSSPSLGDSQKQRIYRLKKIFGRIQEASFKQTLSLETEIDHLKIQLLKAKLLGQKTNIPTEEALASIHGFMMKDPSQSKKLLPLDDRKWRIQHRGLPFLKFFEADISQHKASPHHELSLPLIP
jgi:hypothetical protein